MLLFLRDNSTLHSQPPNFWSRCETPCAPSITAIALKKPIPAGSKDIFCFITRSMNVLVKYGEIGLGRKVKAAGGKWNRERKVWELPYDMVVKFGLKDRIVAVPPEPEAKMFNSRNNLLGYV